MLPCRIRLRSLPRLLGQSLAPPGKGQGKGKTKGLGKGGPTSPGERKAPNLKPLSERATPTVEEVSCTRCKAYNWTSRRVCRSCGAPLPQGNSQPQPHLTPTGQAKTSAGVPSSSSVASSGLSYAAVTKGATGQADPKKDDKTVLAQKADKLENLLATLDDTDPPQRGSPATAGPTAERSQRSPPTRSSPGLSSGQAEESRGQSCPLRRSTPPGGRFFAAYPRRESCSRLRVEGSPRGSCPGASTAHTPPGGCRLEIVLRGHGRLDRHAQAVWPSCRGGARGAGAARAGRRYRQTTQGRPLRCSRSEISQGDRPTRQPCLSQQARRKRSLHTAPHATPRGRECWGWIVHTGNPGCFSLRGRSPTQLPKSPGLDRRCSNPSGHPLPGRKPAGGCSDVGKCIGPSMGGWTRSMLLVIPLACLCLLVGPEPCLSFHATGPGPTTLLASSLACAVGPGPSLSNHTTGPGPTTLLASLSCVHAAVTQRTSRYALELSSGPAMSTCMPMCCRDCTPVSAQGRVCCLPSQVWRNDLGSPGGTINHIGEGGSIPGMSDEPNAGCCEFMYTCGSAHSSLFSSYLRYLPKGPVLSLCSILPKWPAILSFVWILPKWQAISPFT